MSRSTIPLEIIYAGVHLVIPSEVEIIKDKDNLPVVTKDGSSGIIVKFSDGKSGASITHNFWLPSSEFTKFCKVMGVDLSKLLRKQLIGKSLWICVKEVKTMIEDKCLKSNWVIFDFIECSDPQKRPMISGDPIQHLKGEPLGVFVEYVQSENIYDGVKVKMHHEDEIGPWPEDLIKKAFEEVKPKEERIALAKKIIAEGEKKEMTSLNQANKPKTDWDDL